jgi:hypothetical protein
MVTHTMTVDYKACITEVLPVQMCIGAKPNKAALPLAPSRAGYIRAILNITLGVTGISKSTAQPVVMTQETQNEHNN